VFIVPYITKSMYKSKMVYNHGKTIKRFDLPICGLNRTLNR